MADYISRDYTVENMENYPWDTEHDKNAAIHLVRELVPAADVRPVMRGHWEDMPDHYYTWKRCSACGTENAYAYTYILDLDKYEYVQQDNFCPQCGADMREQGGEGGA